MERMERKVPREERKKEKTEGTSRIHLVWVGIA